VVERKALDVLGRAGRRSGHIFNLGHGVLPGTRPETLQRLVDLVHERTDHDADGERAVRTGGGVPTP
jgi:uroporphyrinogen-III decarboxylase